MKNATKWKSYEALLECTIIVIDELPLMFAYPHPIKIFYITFVSYFCRVSNKHLSLLQWNIHAIRDLVGVVRVLHNGLFFLLQILIWHVYGEIDNSTKHALSCMYVMLVSVNKTKQSVSTMYHCSIWNLRMPTNLIQNTASEGNYSQFTTSNFRQH